MRCKLCAPKPTDISAYRNSSSNLKKHVARIHPNKLKVYEELIKSRKRGSSDSVVVDEPHSKKNPKIMSAFSSPATKVTQGVIDKLLINFVCEGNQPFSIVELPSFKKMIETLQPQCTVMTRKTLRLKVQDAFGNMKSAIVQKLNNAEYVATTADCWSARQRSYLGVTCHWIDSTSFERCSAALACRRMTGSHTFDVIAAALEEIHVEYKIRGKITRTTTDSGSNFLKAFRIYGVEKDDAQEERDFIPDDESDESESEMEYQELSGILDGDCGLEYQLPRHQKCACHLLNLVATVDASAAETGSEAYKRLSRSAFAKCSALWNKSSRSTLAFETVERECKLQFLRPNQTRWNSLFLAVERLVRIQREQGEQAIRNVCTALKIKMLNTAELGFLAEYAIVMKPLAMALNLLQGESSVHMGFLLPTLHQLLEKLKRLESTCKTCQPLLKALCGGILKRFGETMKEPELIAAAILLPKFRTAWTTDQSILTTGLDYIKDQLEVTMENEALSYSSPSDEEDFFGSMKMGQSETGELERYLSCPSAGGMDLLHSFPQVKKLSLKVNTAIPASAACERLFSHAGLLLTAKRSRLHCKFLESQLLLKFNSKIL
ncbi:zinc finger BED domain-containing protein 4-like [Pseudorasbora parva]|uniref:zinc finger BED domain-containing protein 4-like n=1 Tax=Pseudorasbora parva TaxID=51549 RepID=UPI00351DCEF1